MIKYQLILLVASIAIIIASEEIAFYVNEDNGKEGIKKLFLSILVLAVTIFSCVTYIPKEIYKEGVIDTLNNEGKVIYKKGVEDALNNKILPDSLLFDEKINRLEKNFK